VGSDLALYLDQRDEITDVFQFADLGGGKLDLESFFDGQQQADVGEAVPAVYILRGEFRRDVNGVFIEDVLEDLFQPRIDLLVVQSESPQEQFTEFRVWATSRIRSAYLVGHSSTTTPRSLSC
jgi:hypothetical protein